MTDRQRARGTPSPEHAADVKRGALPGSVFQGTLDTVVRRIVESVRPRQIILFGSAARGDMHPDSDLDLVIVMPEGVDRRSVARRVYQDLVGVGFAADILVVESSAVLQASADVDPVLRTALDEGRLIYAA